MSGWWWVFDGFLVVCGYMLCWFTKDFIRMTYLGVETEVQHLKDRIHALTGK